MTELLISLFCFGLGLVIGLWRREVDTQKEEVRKMQTRISLRSPLKTYENKIKD